MKSASILLLGLAGTLAACGGADAPPPPPNAAAQAPQPLPNSNIFATQVRALDKARNVQNIMDQRKVNTDKQLQDADKQPQDAEGH